MQKKIIALAIASALVAPAAFADTSNVTVYGLLNADMENVSISNLPAANATPSSKTRMTSNASRFGVKGSEDLGDGLSAIWQVEARVNLVNNEATAGAFNGIRNTNVGLKGSFGTVFLGNWDTPYKVSHNKVELFDNTTIATATALMGSNGAATVPNGGVVANSTNVLASGAFNARENSSIQYWTPDMSGFQAKLAYSTHNSVAATKAVGAAQGLSPSLLSLSAAYENDMMYVAYAYENHKSWANTTNINDNDTGNRLVGAYKFDGGQVGLAYETLNATRAGISKSRAAWELSGKYKFGASNVGAFYTKAGLLGGVAATGANQISLRYGYNFSKRTEAYALYTAIKNDTNANYGIADVANGYTGVAGSKISGLGFGLVHTF